MKYGIYKNHVCENTRLVKVFDNKLEVEFDDYCSWCCKNHVWVWDKIGRDNVPKSEDSRNG